MDFGFSFTAATSARAIEILERVTAPPAVKSFLAAAIDAAVKHLAEDGYMLYVAASGRLCDAADANLVSTANLTVEPVKLEAVNVRHE